MKRPRFDLPSALAGFAIVAITALLAAARPFAEGPPSGHTGGFDEPTCSACHFGGLENPVDGLFDVLGLPAQVEPDFTVLLTVVLQYPAMKRSGFQLTARREDGAQAGRFLAIDDRVAIDKDGIEYLIQTETGSYPVDLGVARWKVRWVAPSEIGPVVIHGAANAANGDDSPLGDAILSRTWSTRVVDR